MTQFRYGLYPGKVTIESSGNPLNFTQLGTCHISAGNKHSQIFVAGDVYRKAALLSHGDPLIALRTADFESVLAVTSLDAGVYCVGSCDFWNQRRLNGGVFDSGNNHTKISATKGHLCIEHIAARQDDVNGAQLACKFYPLWDGTNNPLIPAIGQALAGPTPAFVCQYYLAKVYYNGSLLEGVQGFDYTTGTMFAPKRADGDPWARKGSVVQVANGLKVMMDGTMITPGTIDLFNSALAGNFDFYLRKGIVGGVRYADNTNNHIKFRIAAGAAHQDENAGEGLGDVTFAINVMPYGAVSLTTGTTIP